MAFLNEAKAEADAKLGRKPSKLAEIQSKLGAKEYKEFVVACLDKNITSAGISRALKKRGVKCAPNTVAYLRAQLEEDDNDNK